MENIQLTEETTKPYEIEAIILDRRDFSILVKNINGDEYQILTNKFKGFDEKTIAIGNTIMIYYNSNNEIDHFKTRIIERKSRTTYIFLGILLGNLGLHNFYIENIKDGVIQLVISVLLSWTLIVPFVIWIWAVSEVIRIKTDNRGIELI